MGTRAQFFIGDPMDLKGRKWLGTIGWDGYPDGACGAFAACKTEAEFRAVVAELSERDDFCDPTKHGFPFPWTDDLFLTDYTYAFFDGRVMMTCFHRGWIELAAYVGNEELREAYGEQEDALPDDVAAPTAVWDRSGPDSIMMVSARDEAA